MLYSLARQDYGALFEIILVNDSSMDNYIPVIESFKKHRPAIPLHIVDCTYSPTVDLTGKQQALEMGIQYANYDWIVFTDADMVFPAHWLSSLAAGAGSQHEFVFGHTVLVKQGRSFLQWLQAYQLEFLFACSYAFHSAGLMGSCMGNNILFSKTLYAKFGGQAGLGYTVVEDRELLKKAYQHQGNPHPIEPFFPNAQTMPCSSYSQFFQQMLRWIKGGGRGSGVLATLFLLLGVHNMIFIGSLFLMWPFPLLGMSAVTLLMLVLFAYYAFKKIGSSEQYMLFPIYYCIFIIESLVMALPAILLPPVWKEKRL